MQKLISLILLSIFFALGCQDDNSILEPTNNFSEASLSSKGRVIWNRWINLPEEGLGKLVDGTLAGWTVTEYVTSNKDTELIIKEEYKGGIWGNVKIEVSLKIFAGTLKNDAYVAMYVNNEDGTVTLKSTQVFNKYAELNVKFEGLDLSETTNNDLSFGLLNEYGIIEPTKYINIKMDESVGKIELEQGMVLDFTQYGISTTN